MTPPDGAGEGGSPAVLSFRGGFGLFLSQVLEASGVSRMELLRRLGMPAESTYVSRICSGQVNLTVDQMERVLRPLGGRVEVCRYSDRVIFSIIFVFSP